MLVRILRIYFVMIFLCLSFACERHNATILPKLQINKNAAEMGTPIEVTYSFSTKKDYVALQRDLTVFCHFIDSKKVIRFQDDHLPPIKTSQWRPDGNYHYTRTVFIPKNIPAGEYSVVLGLYTPGKGERVPMDSKEYGNRSYKVDTLLIEIPPQEPVIQYSKGWHDPETQSSDIATSWRWTKKEAILKVKNPKADSLLYLKADSSPERFQGPQTVKLSVGNSVIDTFQVTSNQPFMKKYNVNKDQLGDGKTLDIKVEVDKTFVPADDKVSPDTRELGLRVYELYLGRAADQ